MSGHGYHGKVLRIDLSGLSEQRWSIEEPGELFWRRYGGGGLLAAYYLLRETPPGIDAFDPANLLVLTSSVVAGHPYAELARFTAAGKSPLTGGIGESARGKGAQFQGAQRALVRCDTLDLCVFAIAPTRALTLDDMAELLGRSPAGTRLPTKSCGWASGASISCASITCARV